MGIQRTRDVALNDSDKTFTVPAGQRWTLLYANVQLIATATAGNRQIVLQILDAAAGNVMFEAVAGLVQIASATREYNFGSGLPRETAEVAGQAAVPIPENLTLNAGMAIRVFDSAAIAAAADDMTVAFVVDAE